MPLIHPLWDPPPRDAPRLQREAYRYMLQSLRRIATPIPEILSAPEEVSGARVMEAASATLLNPKIPHELRTGALKMLQLRMRSVDPTTPERLYITRDPHENTIAPDFGDQLSALTAFEDALHAFLLQRRHLEPAAIGNVATERQALIELGVLEALLITRLGWCSVVALAQVTGLIGQKPYVYTPWAWVDVEMSGSNGAPQLRRLFLDPVTLAAWLAAQRHAPNLPIPPPRLKAGKIASFRTTLARNAFKALVEQMTDAGQPSPIRSLRELCAAETQRLYATTLPLLATYAKGDLASSSLHPDTWQRLLGCTVPDRDATHPPTRRYANNESTTPLPTDLPVPTKVSNAEAAAEGDSDEDGLIDELRRIMNLPRGDWPAGFDTLIERLAAQGDNNETARFITSWLRYLATDYRSKGKRLHDGSIRYYRGLLANRLLECLPPSLDGVSEEELHDAYAEVIRSRTSPGQTRNLRMALGAFDRYIRTFQYPNLPHTPLFAADAGSYTISNRIISDADYQAGLKAIDDGSVVIADTDVRRQARAFWILAFRLGMRRREILGLQVRDVNDPFVWVRKNPARALKTPNAYRLLTLQPIPDSERAAVTALLPDRKGRYDHRFDYVFFGPEAPSAAALDAHPAIAPVRALLERITGDPHLHPHNLRHSFATLYLLGCLGSDFGLASHPCATGFMRDCIARATQLASVTAGRLHGKAARGAALGMLMGHGSELTTYEHYVHCLDLLLFVACTQPERPLRDVSPREQLARDRDAIRALLGRSASARLPGANVLATLPGVLRGHGDQVVVLQSRPARPEANANIQQHDGFPALHTLIKASPATQRGYPTTQAARDTAEALLATFRSIPAAQRQLLASLLSRWIKARMKNDDWASMNATDAQAWIADATALGTELPIEVSRVTRGTNGNKKQFYPLTPWAQPRLYRNTSGRYWIRFADTRSRKPRTRKLKTAQRRARTQPSVSWLVCTLCNALCHAQTRSHKARRR